jgi:hypothetical protein
MICNPNYFYLNAACLSVCPDPLVGDPDLRLCLNACKLGYYVDNKICKICDITCKSCVYPGTSSCKYLIFS